jgi:hypothetical protein
VPKTSALDAFEVGDPAVLSNLPALVRRLKFEATAIGS